MKTPYDYMCRGPRGADGGGYGKILENPENPASLMSHGGSRYTPLMFAVFFSSATYAWNDGPNLTCSSSFSLSFE